MQSQYILLLFLFSCWFGTLLAIEDTSMGFLLFMGHLLRQQEQKHEKIILL